MSFNPNDESTLTSVSADTPEPTENNADDSDDVVLLKFAQIYTCEDLLNCQDSQDWENTCHSDLSGSLNDVNDERDYETTRQTRNIVPEEVTCRDDDISFSDKSFEVVASPLGHATDDSLDSSLHCPCPDRGHVILPQLPNTDKQDRRSFQSLRLHYLIVTLVIMLADGLQGTHLYVLYEGYGFPVASLYCLGFVTGGLASPITGPLVDKLGRKRSALLYCVLEIAINMLEQYPVLPGLIISRMVGGVTTNLLSTVFDAWLDTEYRRRGLDKEGYEIIMRDSVIVSNLAAIGSGYLAHILAERYGPVGPFEGAVTFTSIALIVVLFIWTENYGCGEHQVKGMGEFLGDAVAAFQSDKRVLRVGIIQGLTCASIQIFIFLWSPALRHFAMSAPKGALGLDINGEPAYGLIFGAFMAAGVLGGLAAPFIRKIATFLLSPLESRKATGRSEIRPMALEFLASICYLFAALLLLVPCLLPGDATHSFTICLISFLTYEFLVGIYLPCEGVLRSIYFPAEGRASIMTLPRLIVNGAVSLGVVSTNYITMRSAFSSIVFLMSVSAILQFSLISNQQWSTIAGRFGLWSDKGSTMAARSSVNFHDPSHESHEKPLLTWSRSPSPELETSSCSSSSSNFDSTPCELFGHANQDDQAIKTKKD